MIVEAEAVPSPQGTSILVTVDGEERMLTVQEANQYLEDNEKVPCTGDESTCQWCAIDNALLYMR